MSTDRRLAAAAANGDPARQGDPPGLEEHPAAGRTGSPPLAPLLVDIRGLSKLLSRSIASLARDDAAGRLPAGLRIGSSKRWRYSEIVAWVEAGCPSRKEWMARNGHK
jgi:hypothetical protein